MPPAFLHDLLDDGDPIAVLAEVSFVPASEGGKSHPIRGRYRPNHNFGSAENRLTYVGQLEFAPDVVVWPGDTRRVTIRFLSGSGLDALLSVGREWRIQEGPRLVARARVVVRLPGVEQVRR